MDPLDDLPPESRREVAAAVATALGVSTEDAETIVRASEPLWDAMEEVGGLVDSWGGGEFCNLFPQMCAVLKPTSATSHRSDLAALTCRDPRGRCAAGGSACGTSGSACHAETCSFLKRRGLRPADTSFDGSPLVLVP